MCVTRTPSRCPSVDPPERGGHPVQVRPISSCCDPLLDAALDDSAATDLAGAFKVLADPVRLRLLSLVANAPEGELCACDLPELVGRSQPTVSHHLKILTEAGLLRREQRGRWAWFRIEPERLSVLRDALAP
ncbi:MAG: winged helix-turn-helix transcriptional regulator [Nitriliruptoraceae bacterium]|nr:winged helix-turn-helix transcriptional regulator [Nitriliruptoraceae bacterium]